MYGGFVKVDECIRGSAQSRIVHVVAGFARDSVRDTNLTRPPHRQQTIL